MPQVSFSNRPALQKYAVGITTVDCQFMQPGFAAMHIVQRQGEVALIDCGANESVPHILDALRQLGLERSAVKYLFLTHIHLDHAGGSGLLLRELPKAQVVAHPRATRHLVDPGALAAASSAVYGRQAFERMYGILLPIERQRIVESTDGQPLSLGASELSVFHTPGHAMHHHVLFDTDTASIFTGDTFGLSYRATDTSRGPFIVPTTSPSQFDPDQLLSSIDTIVELQPKAAYLTHFGCVTGIVTLAEELRVQLELFVGYAQKHRTCVNREGHIWGEIRTLWQARLAKHGLSVSLERVEQLLGNDLRLNAQGLVAWLQRLER